MYRKKKLNGMYSRDRERSSDDGESSGGKIVGAILAAAITAIVPMIRSCDRPYDGSLAQTTSPRAILFNYKRDGKDPNNMAYAVWKDNGKTQIGEMQATKNSVSTGDDSKAIYYNYSATVLVGHTARYTQQRLAEVFKYDLSVKGGITIHSASWKINSKGVCEFSSIREIPAAEQPTVKQDALKILNAPTINVEETSMAFPANALPFFTQRVRAA